VPAPCQLGKQLHPERFHQCRPVVVPGEGVTLMLGETLEPKRAAEKTLLSLLDRAVCFYSVLAPTALEGVCKCLSLLHSCFSFCLWVGKSPGEVRSNSNLLGV